jgi:hypothetical protein
MKKIITLVFLLFLTVSSFSQNASYARAYELNVGAKTGETIKWDESPIKVNILISIEENVVKMYSDKTQVYHIINLVDSSDNFSKWLCSDTNGIRCYLYLGKLRSEDKTIFFGIEYSDYSWVYFCYPEN